MDPAVIGGVVVALLAVIPAAGAYFSREVRKIRKVNRQLQAVCLEYKLHLFTVEGDLAQHGIRPRPRPALIRAVEYDGADEGDAEEPPATGDGGAGEAPGRSPRHAAG